VYDEVDYRGEALKNTASHQRTSNDRKPLNRLHNRMLRRCLRRVARFVFQACSFNGAPAGVSRIDGITGLTGLSHRSMHVEFAPQLGGVIPVLDPGAEAAEQRAHGQAVSSTRWMAETIAVNSRRSSRRLCLLHCE